MQHRELTSLSSTNARLALQVSEHPARGIEAVGATEVRVYSLEEAVEVLRNGARYRMTAPTLMNQVSSRSHTIFTLRLDQVRGRDEAEDTARWPDLRSSTRTRRHIVTFSVCFFCREILLSACFPHPSGRISWSRHAYTIVRGQM